MHRTTYLADRSGYLQRNGGFLVPGYGHLLRRFALTPIDSPVLPEELIPVARSRSLSDFRYIGCNPTAADHFYRSYAFTVFLPHSYGYGSANPAKTVLAGVEFRFDAESPTSS